MDLRSSTSLISFLTFFYYLLYRLLWINFIIPIAKSFQIHRSHQLPIHITAECILHLCAHSVNIRSYLKKKSNGGTLSVKRRSTVPLVVKHYTQGTFHFPFPGWTFNFFFKLWNQFDRYLVNRGCWVKRDVNRAQWREADAVCQQLWGKNTE